MALRLSAVNRWCVTGTPIQKGVDGRFSHVPHGENIQGYSRIFDFGAVSLKILSWADYNRKVRNATIAHY